MKTATQNPPETDPTLKHELAMFDAFVRGDARTIDALMADDYLSINHDGTLV
jgi:hypothetical protein